MMACKRLRRLALDAIVYVYDDVGAIIHATAKAVCMMIDSVYDGSLCPTEVCVYDNVHGNSMYGGSYDTCQTEIAIVHGSLYT